MKKVPPSCSLLENVPFSETHDMCFGIGFSWGYVIVYLIKFVLALDCSGGVMPCSFPA